MISVLYVDDEPDLLEIAQLFLNASGEFNITVSTSAQESLESLSTQSYETIISDYQMPGMDGIEFLKAVREKFGDIPFILFTGRGREEVVIEAINNGADFYLQKGGNPTAQFAELAQKVRQAVRRRRAELDLQKSEARYRSVVNDQTEMIARFTPDGTITFINEAYRLYFVPMLDLDEIEGKNIRDLMRIGNYEEVENFLTSLTPQASIREMERMVTGGDKKTYWQLWSVRALFNEKGKPVEYQVVGQDITRQKMAETEIRAIYEQISAVEAELRQQYEELALSEQRARESEEKFRALADTAPMGIIVIQGTRDIYINDHVVKATGYSREEIISMDFWEIIHPDQREEVKESGLAWLRRERPSTTSEIRYVTKSGETKWALLTEGEIVYGGKPAGFVLMLGITERKRIEAELRKAYEQLAAANEALQVQYDALKESRHRIQQREQDYRSIIENMQDAYYRTDAQGNLVMISPSFVLEFGYSDEKELIGKNFRDIFYINPAEREEVLRQLETSGKIKEHRITLRRHDGSPIVVSTSSHVFYDENGKPAGVEGILHDMTDAVNAEKAVRESEEKFRGMAERSSDLIIILDNGMSPTYVSPSAQSIIGYDPEELVGKTPEFATATIFSESGPELMNAVQATMEGLPVENLGIRITNKDGTPVYVTMHAAPVLHEGKLAGVQVTMRDITAGKKAEQALRESEEKFRSFVENANDIIYSMTPDGILTYISPQWTELVGYDPGEAIGRSFDSLIHPDDLPADHKFLRQTVMSGEKRSGIEYRIRHKNGTWLWHNTTVSPILSAEGEIVSIQSISRDVTESRRSEDALRLANRQLNLLTGITRHDIINKVSVALGYLKLAEMNSKDPTQDELLGKMESAITAIQSQIEFTRVYEDIGTHEPQWIDLDAVMPRSQIPATVTLNAEVNDVQVFSDPMLEKVFSNLLDNAVGHGQRVTEVRVSSHQSAGNLVVAWEDNGIGIGADEKERIFERGFGKNTGLGLFLVREILSLTGITIAETGEPGQGARFEMTVPQGGYRLPR